jgi:hypothetical protein
MTEDQAISLVTEIISGVSEQFKLIQSGGLSRSYQGESLALACRSGNGQAKNALCSPLATTWDLG